MVRRMDVGAVGGLRVESERDRCESGGGVKEQERHIVALEPIHSR